MNLAGPIHARFRKRALGCLAVVVGIPPGLALLLGPALHENGAWGVWKKSTNQVVPEVRSLASRSGVVFVGTEGAGVFRSADGGLTWQPFSRGLTDPQVMGLAVEPRTGTLYAAGRGGLRRFSTTRDSWERIGDVEDCSSIVGIGVDPWVLLALCDGNILRSIGGDLWVSVPAPPGERFLQDLLSLERSREILLLGSEGLWRSRDAGLAWERIGPPSAGDELSAVARSPALPSFVVVGTFASALSLSWNGGRQWSALEAPPGRWDQLAVAGRTPVLLAAGDGVLYRKRLSEGAMDEPWEAIPWLHGGCRLLVVDPERPERIYGGSVSGFWRSDDSGKTWAPAEQDLEDAFAVVDMVWSGTRLFAVTDHQTTLSSENGGRIWHAVGPRHPFPLADSMVIRVSEPCQLLISHVFGWGRSTDCGATWTHGREFRRKDLISTSGDSAVVYARHTHEGLVLRSPDFGRGWQPILRGTVRTISIDPLDPNHLYAAGNELRLGPGTGDGLAESRDGGRSWNLIETPFSPLRIASLAPSPTIRGRLLAGVDGEAWLYSPGEGWQPLSRGASEVRDLVEHPGRPEVLYACTESGVVASEDGGRSWVEITSPHDQDCRRLVPVENGSALLMVAGAQVYRLELRSGWWMALWLLWQLAKAGGDG